MSGKQPDMEATPIANLVAQSRPQQVIDLESTGWVCCQVTATTWRCSRTLGGMRMVTTVSA